MPLTLIVTTAGRNALPAPAGTGLSPVLIAEIGLSQTHFAATAATSALTGETKRVDTFAGSDIDPATLHVQVTDDSSDAYSLRSFALYLDDGTLFAVYSQADPIAVKTAATALLMAADIVFDDIDAATITFGDTNLAGPPATDTTPGVVRLATEGETEAGTDDEAAVTPAGLAAALTAALTGVDVITAQNLIANGGYIVHSNGLIECWGYVTVSADSAGYYNLPAAHTDWCVPTVTPDADDTDLNWVPTISASAVIGSPPTQIKIWNAANSSAGCWVRTIGK